jgi:Fe-S cluster biosynthesis and repair protein YggX
MSGTVHCVRCGREDGPALPRPPVPGKIGLEVQQKICTTCWQDWEKAEIMFINELRLNFMDPSSHAALEEKMREFLFQFE